MAEDSGGCEDTFEFRSDSESCVGSLLGGEDVYDSDWLVEEDGSRGRSPSPGFGSDADNDDDGYASDATVRPQSFKTVRRDVAEDSDADSELDDVPKMGLRLGLRAHRTTHQDYSTQSWIVYQLNEGIILISQRFRLWSRIAPKYIWEMPTERVFDFLARLKPLTGYASLFSHQVTGLDTTFIRTIDPILNTLLLHRKYAPAMKPETRQSLQRVLEEILEIRLKMRFNPKNRNDQRVYAPAKAQYDLSTTEGLRRFREVYPFLTNRATQAAKLAQILGYRSVNLSAVPHDKNTVPRLAPVPEPVANPTDYALSPKSATYRWTAQCRRERLRDVGSRRDRNVTMRSARAKIAPAVRRKIGSSKSTSCDSVRRHFASAKVRSTLGSRRASEPIIGKAARKVTKYASAITKTLPPFNRTRNQPVAQAAVDPTMAGNIARKAARKRKQHGLLFDSRRPRSPSSAQLVRQMSEASAAVLKGPSKRQAGL